MAFGPLPAAYNQAIRGSHAVTFTADATFQGAPIVGAMGMQPTGGSVSDTTKPGVRRQLALELAPEPGLYDLLNVTGTRVSVTAHVSVNSVPLVDVPMGLFIVTEVSQSEGGAGPLKVTGQDKFYAVTQAKFMGPRSSTPGMTITQQIVSLLQEVFGASEPVTVTASSTAKVGTLTWQSDRAQAINDLATSIGAWVFADRYGALTIANQPTFSTTAQWLVDASPQGVMVSLDRQKSRAQTFNVVVVDSSSTSSSLFPTQYVWDANAASPTYAGPGGSGTTPPDISTAGSYGLVPYLYSDPNLADAVSAQVAGRAILARTVGIASSINATQVPNPALDAFDQLDVMPPLQRADIPRVVERHFADTVTHSLDVTAAQQIQGRSTRSDPYT